MRPFSLGIIENFLNHDTALAERVEASMPFDKLRANGVMI